MHSSNNLDAKSLICLLRLTCLISHIQSLCMLFFFCPTQIHLLFLINIPLHTLGKWIPVICGVMYKKMRDNIYFWPLYQSRCVLSEQCQHIADWTGLNFDGCQLGLRDFKWKPICDICSQRLLAGKSRCYVNSTPVRPVTSYMEENLPCTAWIVVSAASTTICESCERKELRLWSMNLCLSNLML